MERCSFFIPNKALFGGYPTQTMTNTLEKNGVRYFVDLTCRGEKKIIPYKTQYTYISYPIQDHKIPRDWCSFAQLIIKVCNIIKKLKNGELIYINCKGGHGRAGIVVASILCHILQIPPDQAISLTSEYHADRKEMKEKWRHVSCPNKKSQQDFVRLFFKPLFFYKAYIKGLTAGMSNFSMHCVNIPKFGYFPTSEAAFQAFKAPNNKNYIKKQEQSLSPLISKRLGYEVKLRPDWKNVRNQIMFNILNLKFSQHTVLKNNLLNTGLRPIINHGPDRYWGDGINGRGKNILGKLLVILRNRMYLKKQN